MATCLILLAGLLCASFMYRLYRFLTFSVTIKHDPDKDRVLGYFTNRRGREYLTFFHSHEDGMENLYGRVKQELLPAPYGVGNYTIPRDARVCKVKVCRKYVLVTFRRPSRLNRKAFTGYVQLWERTPPRPRYQVPDLPSAPPGQE